MFEYFTENDLISHSQSGFKPGDSFINQLLSVTHEVSKSYDEGYETRGVFLNISKPFDNGWYESLLHKFQKLSLFGMPSKTAYQVNY